MGRRALWINDWIKFTNELEIQLKGGAGAEDLALVFGGARVRWCGTIEEIDIDELAQLVNVALPERMIQINHGKSIPLDGLTLVVSTSAIPVWRHFSPGDEVTFEATLGEAGSPFSLPVEVQPIDDEESMIVVRASDAVPIV